MKNEIFLLLNIFLLTPLLGQKIFQPIISEKAISNGVENGTTGSGTLIPPSDILRSLTFIPLEFMTEMFWPDSGSRKKRSATVTIEGELSRKKRILVAWNQTIQGRLSCIGCSQILRCYVTNKGIVTTCKGLFPYCNNGLCSRYLGSVCSDTTSSTITISSNISTSSSSNDITTPDMTSTTTSNPIITTNTTTLLK